MGEENEAEGGCIDDEKKNMIIMRSVGEGTTC
jgi:hypothetical protein